MINTGAEDQKRENILCVGEEKCKTERDTESMHGNEGETRRGEYDQNCV